MIKDRNGNVIPEDMGQKKLLNAIYNTVSGRRLLKILTHPALSRAAGAFLDSPLSVPLIKPFIRRHRIDMRQYEKKEYRSYNEFFARKIRPECRPFDDAPDALISPCDAKLTVYPIDRRDCVFRIKGSYYSVADILENQFLADRYLGGWCMIFRLTPDDYHRYCYIDHGSKGHDNYILGQLHTVNPIAFRRYNVYKRNSRVCTTLHTDYFGDVTQVEVGAMLVGRIVNYHDTRFFSKGEEKGRFEYGGSTVVLFIEKGYAAPDKDILENSKKGIETVVRCGESIGRGLRPINRYAGNIGSNIRLQRK